MCHSRRSSSVFSLNFVLGENFLIESSSIWNVVEWCLRPTLGYLVPPFHETPLQVYLRRVSLVSSRRDRALDAAYVPEERTLRVSLLYRVLPNGGRESCNPQRRYKSPPPNRDKRMLLTAQYYICLAVPEDRIGNGTLRS